MSGLKDYMHEIKRDNFEAENKRDFGFPCSACIHKVKTDSEEPCIRCDHNLNCLEDFTASLVINNAGAKEKELLSVLKMIMNDVGVHVYMCLSDDKCERIENILASYDADSGGKQ